MEPAIAEQGEEGRGGGGAQGGEETRTDYVAACKCDEAALWEFRAKIHWRPWNTIGHNWLRSPD